MKDFKREIQVTKDGSKTLYIPEMDESYHSHHGTLIESQHIFIDNGLKALNKDAINLLEIGFGTGLNAITSYTYSEKMDHIYYDGLELYPVQKEIIDEIDHERFLNDEEKKAFKKMHDIEWGISHGISDQFTLRKIQSDFTTHEYDRLYDLIYFDAFAPNKQEEMWSVDLFDKLYKSCNPNAVLVTYCVRGTVKRALKEVGFTIEKLKGPEGGKREMLRAIKS